MRENSWLGWGDDIQLSPLWSLHLLVLRSRRPLLRLLLVALGLFVLPLVPADLPRERLHVEHEVDLVEVNHAEVLLRADRQLLGLLSRHARGRRHLAALARVRQAGAESGDEDAARDNLKSKNTYLNFTPCSIRAKSYLPP